MRRFLELTAIDFWALAVGWILVNHLAHHGAISEVAPYIPLMLGFGIVLTLVLGKPSAEPHGMLERYRSRGSRGQLLVHLIVITLGVVPFTALFAAIEIFGRKQPDDSWLLVAGRIGVHVVSFFALLLIPRLIRSHLPGRNSRQAVARNGND